MTAALFTPLSLGTITLCNRIAVAPMCQYMANDGCAGPWHLQHLAGLGMSGAGLVMLEATAVSRRGRITHGCLGLYSDAAEAALGATLAQVRDMALPGTAFGVQLSHAGRKGSATRPWEAGGALMRDSWPTLAPSALPHREGWHQPQAATEADLDAIEADFRAAAERALRLGFEVIEVHMAHGYLLHQFHSALSNWRDDAWGGDAERRMAFPLRIAAAVRAAAPGLAVGARITGSDWSPNGLDVSSATALAGRLKALGLDYVCVTSGGIPVASPSIADPDKAQIGLAARVRAATGLATRAVGLIVTPQQANAILDSGQADQVAIGRAFLDDPRWAWHAAHQLGVTLAYPPPYAWAAPAEWPGMAKAHKSEQSSYM